MTDSYFIFFLFANSIFASPFQEEEDDLEEDEESSEDEDEERKKKKKSSHTGWQKASEYCTLPDDH